MKSSIRTLLLGMGNPLLSDDAVGIRLAAEFGRRLGDVAGLEIMEECSAGGLDLLPIIDGYDSLIVVDSVKTSGGVPGNWFHFTADKLRDTIHLANIHDANFATALMLGRRLGMRIPPDRAIHIFAVEVLDDLTFGEGMTDTLEKAYPICVEEIFYELRILLQAAY